MNRITRISLLAKTKEELVDLIARMLNEYDPVREEE